MSGVVLSGTGKGNITRKTLKHSNLGLHVLRRIHWKVFKFNTFDI